MAFPYLNDFLLNIVCDIQKHIVCVTKGLKGLKVLCVSM